MKNVSNKSLPYTSTISAAVAAGAAVAAVAAGAAGAAVAAVAAVAAGAAGAAVAQKGYRKNRLSHHDTRNRVSDKRIGAFSEVDHLVTDLMICHINVLCL